MIHLWKKINTKLYRSTKLLPLESLLDNYPRAIKVIWWFFRGNIPSKSTYSPLDNFYHKLPTRSRLHKLLSSHHSDPLCPLCGGFEDDEHFYGSVRSNVLCGLR
jgi:hypothetical protein